MKGLIITGIVTLVLLFGGVMLLSKGGSTSNQKPVTADSSVLVRADSHQTNKDAKVSVVEFGDYECPACAQAYPIVKQLEKDYGDKVNFVFRNYPLTQHKNAQIAAEAAEAANAQGKFWEMHDKLYEKQSEWGESDSPMDKFLVYAKDLGLDVNKFKSDVSSSKYSTFIQSDVSDGNTVGINATPTFYVNGEMLVGLPAYSGFSDKINAFLK